MGDGQCGEHDGQMGFDGIALAGGHGPGIEIGLRHPKRLANMLARIFREIPM